MPSDVKAPVEEYLKTPEFQKFRKSMGQMMKIQQILQSGFLQKMAEVEPFKKALGLTNEKIKGLVQQMPKPISELHQQPEANAGQEQGGPGQGQGQQGQQGQGMDFSNTQVTY